MHWSTQVLQSVSSTQDVVKDLAWADAPEGVVVQALAQNSGRGRHGRIWHSQEGNLFCSILLRPDVPLKNVGSLALVAGVALYQAVARDGLTLKWPNDLLLNQQKCAGILLETDIQNGELSSAVLGLGVNIQSAPETGACLGGNAKDTLARFLQFFDPLYQSWQKDGFLAIKDQWLCCSYDEGQAITVKNSSHIVRGHFAGVDDFGNLNIKAADGTLKTITAGEVFLCS